MHCKKKDLDLLSSSRAEIDQRMKTASETLEKILLQGDEALHVILVDILNFINENNIDIKLHEQMDYARILYNKGR